MEIPFVMLNSDNPVTWARGRMPNRIYAYKSFTTEWGSDKGHPGRYVYKVFDDPIDAKDDEVLTWEEKVVYTSPKGRKQLRLHVARNAGVVRQIRLTRVPTDPAATRLETLMELDRSQSRALIDLIRALDSIPAEGEESVHVDDQLLRDFFADPHALGRAYSQDPERFKQLIRTDASAQDVIALKRRRDVVETMRSWLNNDAAFDKAKDEARGPEKAWQRLLEANPWVLGVGLGGQLLTSWDHAKLEQVTSGASIKGAGKRTDALLRTNGIVRSMALAEIKHHRTELLTSQPYRSACWGPSPELSGAVVQVQQTVRMAVRDLGDFLEDRSDDGSRTGTGTFITQPRSFLIVGSLRQLQGTSGGPIDDKVHSFELFRRNVTHPEILTFDELLARAEWHVKLAEQHNSNDGETADSEAGDNSPDQADCDPWSDLPF